MIAKVYAFWTHHYSRKSVESNPAQGFIGRIGFAQFSHQLTQTCLYLLHKETYGRKDRWSMVMLAVLADKGRVIFLK
jgi:hypothetical protein